MHKPADEPAASEVDEAAAARLPSAASATPAYRPGVDFLRIVLPLLVLGVGFAGYFMLASRPAQQQDAAAATAAPLVETVPVEPHTQGMVLHTDGLVVPLREVSLSAEVAGRIVEKADICQAGNFVRQGTLLYQIDQRNYELDVQRLSKELNQANVAVEELEVERTNTLNLAAIAEEELEIQRAELKRLEDLRRQQVITQSELDRGRAAELVSRNALVTLNNQAQLLATRRNRLERAAELVAAQLERAKLDLARTKIHAPIDGMIVQVAIEQDAFVQPGSMLAVIDDTSAAEVSCSLKMDELYWVWRQNNGHDQLPPPTVQSPLPAAAPLLPQAAQAAAAARQAGSYTLPPTRATIVYTLAGRQYYWEGVLSRYESVGLDERTRTVPCRVLIPQPRNACLEDGSPADDGPPALVRGMFVHVKLHVDTGAQLLRVPQQAVRPGNIVWLVEDGQLSIDKVPVAYQDDEWALFDAAAVELTAGDAVVISPLAAPLDGMAVRLANAPAEVKRSRPAQPVLADERAALERAAGE